MSEMEYYWNNIKCWSESDKYEDSNLLIRLFKNTWINIVEFEKVNCYIILWVRYTLKYCSVIEDAYVNMRMIYLMRISTEHI